MLGRAGMQAEGRGFWDHVFVIVLIIVLVPLLIALLRTTPTALHMTDSNHVMGAMTSDLFVWTNRHIKEERSIWNASKVRGLLSVTSSRQICLCNKWRHADQFDASVLSSLHILCQNNLATQPMQHSRNLREQIISSAFRSKKEIKSFLVETKPKVIVMCRTEGTLYSGDGKNVILLQKQK